jgi:hypothetical protein
MMMIASLCRYKDEVSEQVDLGRVRKSMIEERRGGHTAEGRW